MKTLNASEKTEIIEDLRASIEYRDSKIEGVYKEERDTLELCDAIISEDIDLFLQLAEIELYDITGSETSEELEDYKKLLFEQESDRVLNIELEKIEGFELV